MQKKLCITKAEVDCEGDVESVQKFEEIVNKKTFWS